jgi:transposase-like protein
VGSAAKLVARAFERAEARHRITNPDAEPSFDALLREALTEVQVTLSVRRERDHRRIRKAVRRMRAVEELQARIPSIAAAAEAAPAAAVTPAERPPPGPPAWHPEHRLNSEN